MNYLMRFPGGLRKALTLSYDDGVEQDRQLIPILDKYGIRATFNLNSGLWAPDGTVYPQGQIHRRMTLEQVKATYDVSRHEVAVHCLNHASLPELTAEQKINEIFTDRVNLEKLFGKLIRGAAYPFGTFNDEAVEALRLCGIQYCRTVISSHDFSIPNDWLRLPATCHHDDPMLDELCERFLSDRAPFGSKLFYLWGHSYEFEANNNWERIEQFCQRMGGYDEIWYATNIEIVDYINAYRKLVNSADGKTIHNPTATDLWVEIEGKQCFCVKAGETVHL